MRFSTGKPLPVGKIESMREEEFSFARCVVCRKIFRMDCSQSDTCSLTCNGAESDPDDANGAEIRELEDMYPEWGDQ